MIGGMKKVAIQGIKGSFHDQAAGILLPSTEVYECMTFQDVFDAVLRGETEYGIVAIENSIHGSINPVYRLLERHNVWVIGETTLTVDQYLIGPKEVSVAELNVPEAEVRTMFPAFAQCELWLMEHLPLTQRIELYDTAFSVQTVVDEGNPLHVAIAGKHAAAVYGGKILVGPINDDPHNYTRFILLTKERPEINDANRTSIILTTGHKEGALYQAIGAFADAQINLSKLDSHPVPSDRRHYSFYIDLEAGEQDERVQQAFKALKEQGCGLKILGSYRA